MVFTVAFKHNLHVDEVYSYGLSNNVGWFTITDGEMSTPENVFLGYVSASDEDAFNYANVWENQSKDVHPPLYYVLLHTICSFFPGQYSIWFAATINIVSMLFVLYYTRKLIGKFINDEKIESIISMAFIFASGIAHQASFMRMYVLVMLQVIMITCLFVDAIEQHMQLAFYLKAFIIAAAGVLTHYYFAIYLVFCCTVLGIMLLFQKRIKETIGLSLTMIISAAAVLFLFPATIEHTFGGGIEVHSR